ncbi:alpha/beta hydrolase family protein [Paenibacillus spongiae]|uniref:Alpha/beta hydrolase n=1 Tax=Paenibacillus spongiae TaxID=2909671 RepID=A0ABY5SJH5_9BACL|nr:hypothetical protein [Paenibacillus spongiae]UVI33794.1 hypothetical protein L1F29_29005 [Paenibacillus spongiae]
MEFFHGMGADVSHLETNVYNNAPIIHADRTYPVIVYSPEFGVERDMYLFNIQELVGNGFIVITVSAPYESVFTVFPNGEYIRQLGVVVGVIQGTDFDAWDRLLDIRTKGISRLMDELPEMNINHGMLKGKLDLERIGAIGHSLGGAAMFRAAQVDRRIKAGILLDASLHLLGEIKGRIDTPFLLLRQQASTLEQLLKSGMNEIVAREYMNGQKRLADDFCGFKSFIRIKRANHMSFSDVPLHFKEPDIADIHGVINTLTTLFMKRFAGMEGRVYTDLFVQGCLDGTNRINGDGDIME